jgi:hypothetical protein
MLGKTSGFALWRSGEHQSFIIDPAMPDTKLMIDLRYKPSDLWY